MIRFLKCSLLALLVCFFCETASATTYAVVVAIADYQNYPPKNGDLKYTVSDARKFYAYLRSDAGGRIPSNQIRYLVNNAASKKQIISALNYMFSFARREDKVIFYFSGHGDVGAFIPYDFDQSQPSMLFHDEVKRIFKNCRAQTKICIADACYSGSITKKQISKFKAAPGLKSGASDVVILMSSRNNETSIESGSLGQGLFSFFLLKGLNGQADSNRDRNISVKELFVFVHHNVSTMASRRFRASQHPIAYGHFSKELIISNY